MKIVKKKARGLISGWYVGAAGYHDNLLRPHLQTHPRGQAEPSTSSNRQEVWILIDPQNYSPGVDTLFKDTLDTLSSYLKRF